MSDNKQNFLDSTSLIAIGVLVLSWFVWDHYMRQKYPPAPVEKTKNQTLSSVEEEKTEIQKPPVAETLWQKSHRENTLEFEGKNLKILFSSKGLGIKKVTLKNYQNREKNRVVFENIEKPYFANYSYKNEQDFIPFKIKKEGDLFVGTFSSPLGKIKKTLEVDEARFLIKSKTIIEPAKGGLKGLSLLFSHPLPEKTEGGFFSFFLIYGQEIFKAFASHSGNENDLFIDGDLDQKKKFSQLNSAGLGGKYFGKAFINKSSLFPSAVFEKRGKQVFARVDYELLHTKPQTLESLFFVGPKSLKNFRNMDGNLRQWLDFGFFGWLARPLLLFLNWLYSWCGNWGFAIILLTLFVRAGLLPINIKSYKSMKVMQRIQPKIKELKETYKGDPKKMNAEVMALMKENKANPLGGCLPLFLQFPVFFALYRVLGESIELYQAPFVFWIEDLSLKDPFYLLPILGGLVLFIQQSITPMNLPKEQARLMKAIPLLFSVFMLSLPSGLTLYIFVSGFFGLIQQFFFVKLGTGHEQGGKNVKSI